MRPSARQWNGSLSMNSTRWIRSSACIENSGGREGGEKVELKWVVCVYFNICKSGRRERGAVGG